MARLTTADRFVSSDRTVSISEHERLPSLEERKLPKLSELFSSMPGISNLTDTLDEIDKLKKTSPFKDKDISSDMAQKPNDAFLSELVIKRFKQDVADLFASKRKESLPDDEAKLSQPLSKEVGISA